MTNWNFIFNTALRDSRKNRGRLALFMSSILLGITALVAINSFNDNIIRDIDQTGCFSSWGRYIRIR